MVYVKSMDYDPYNPLPRLNHEDGIELERLFDIQSSDMAGEDYVKVENLTKLRRWASLVIFKYSKCENFDAIVPYLAMTYFDLYISRQNPILQVLDNIIHDIELLALCCLTLAWKMRDISFTIPKLQQMQPDLANLTTTQFYTVELRILKSFNWNLRVVTAFCFVPYFVPKCLTPHGFNLKSISEIIVGIQCHEDIGITITKKKPSVIAASALIAATKFLYPRQYGTFVNLVIEEEILREDHEKKFAKSVILACDALALVIESGVIEHNSGPPGRIRVRLGQWRRRKYVLIGESSERMDFPLGWNPARRQAEVFVIFGRQNQTAWPNGPDARQMTPHLIKIALERAAFDLHMEQSRRFCSRVVEHLSDWLTWTIENLCEYLYFMFTLVALEPEY